MNLYEKGLIIALFFLILTLGNVYLHENMSETKTITITRTIITPTNDSEWYSSSLAGDYGIPYDITLDNYDGFPFELFLYTINDSSSFFEADINLLKYGRSNGYGWKAGYCIIWYKDPEIEQEITEQYMAGGITGGYDWSTGICISGDYCIIKPYFITKAYCFLEGYYDHKIQERVTTWFLR